MTPLREQDIVLLPPPPVEQHSLGAMGLLQYLIPLIGSMGSIFFVILNPRPTYLGSSLLFMVGAMGTGIVMAAQQRQAVRRKKEADRALYREYLSGVRQRILDVVERQRAYSARCHPAPSALLDLVVSGPDIWERRPEDGDFMALRVGSGARPLACRIHVPTSENALPRKIDPICAHAMLRLPDAYGQLDGEPITVDLRQARIVGIVGPRRLGLPLARALVCQLAALHAPEEARLMLCTGPAARADWEWAKWLPHLRVAHVGKADDANLPPASDGTGDLETVAAGRLERRTQDAGAPWVVAVADGVDVSTETVSLLRRSEAYRISLVVLAERRDQEPAEVDLEVVVADDGSLALERPGQPEPVAAGLPDRLDEAEAEALARRLTPYRLSAETEAARLADAISLPELLGIQDVGRLDRAATWRLGPLTQRLRVPMGVTAGGDTLVLDLKEAAAHGDGPHGLVIGATGSGKSELLKSIVAGLAITHPPELLAFVLVDFKGGSAFAGLHRLPHVAGMITNLRDDMAMIDRMHVALRAEIQRRQEVLREAGNLPSAQEYQRRREAGEALQPLPYLLLIVDEFAELLSSRPEFIELFVAVGRLGRSLGIHLLFCSQQLDEGRLRGLESHLSYRVALRTFTPQESRTVLGVPDAYTLPRRPGSAYFKVGETITQFRAALSSQAYDAASPSRTDDPRPRPFTLAPPAETPAPPARTGAGATGPTVLDVVVSRLEDEGSRAHQVWLPPLEPRLTLDAVLRRAQRTGALRVPIGLVDKPAEQAQDVLSLDLSAAHLVVVGAAQTGRTTFLRTLVASCALTHTPGEAQFYCIDLGGGGLAPLAGLPHVGGVADERDSDLVRRTVEEVGGLLDAREQLFRRHRIDSAQAMRARRSRAATGEDNMADVFLVVDGYARDVLADDELLDIARRGLRCGVHLVLTTNRWANLRLDLRGEMPDALELRLNPTHSSEIDRRAAESLDSAYRVAEKRANENRDDGLKLCGRGLVREGLQVHTFQTALPRTDGSTEVLDLQRGLGELIAGVAAAWPGPRAAPVRVLPGVAELASLPTPGEDRVAGVPIGLSESLEPVYVDLTGPDSHLIVFGDAESGKTTLLRTFVRSLVSRNPPNRVQVLVVDYRRGLLGAVPEDHLLGYSGAESAATIQVKQTAEALSARLPGPNLTVQELRARSWWRGPEIYVVVDDYDLVVGASGNPLAPLAGLLPQARDVGLHVVLARRSGGASRGILEPLLLRLRELGSAGLLLSGSPQEGVLVGDARPRPMPPGRGILVRRHDRNRIIQVAYCDPDEVVRGQHEDHGTRSA